MKAELYECTFSFVKDSKEYKIVFYLFANTNISSIYVFLKKETDWKIIEAKDFEVNASQINYDMALKILNNQI